MTTTNRSNHASSLTFFFKRQGWNFIALLILLPIAWALAAPVLTDKTWIGVSVSTWFVLAVGIAIVHQGVTWVGWRLQLRWNLLSKLFGKWDLTVWGILFLPLLAARPFLIFGLAMADRGSLMLTGFISIGLGLVLLIPAIYTLWSVKRYFGLFRAMGGDHFYGKYRKMPLVKDGAFAWSGNAMYGFGFLGLWSIALLLESHAALCVALFQHAYIWIHYYCTEQPDMQLLYGSDESDIQN